MLIGPKSTAPDCVDYNGYDSQDMNSRRSDAPVPSSSASSSSGTDTQRNPTNDLSLLQLHKEVDRLKTFHKDRWPLAFLQPQKLAQLGFYYIGPEDTVKCHFCRVEIGKWEPEDNCFSEHSRWSPSCPLLRRQQTDNVPINAEELDQILPPVTYDTCGHSRPGVVVRPNAYAELSFTPAAELEIPSNTTPSSTLSSPGSGDEMMTISGRPSPVRSVVYENTPRFYNPLTTSHLEIEANRLSTFREWPTQMKMKPTELADAGFFYTGLGDRVQCFSCGGGLKNWEENDVAWEQHALWYPNCEYLKLVKDHSYIKEVQDMHRKRQQQETNRESQSSEEEEEEGAAQEQVVNSEDESSPEEVPLGGILPAAAAATVNRVPVTAGHDAMPSTSRLSKEMATRSLRTNRQAALNGSHPEADPRSAQAIAKSQKSNDIPEAKLCKICYECEFNTAFLPCGHVVACGKCALAVSTCPMCRKPFDSVTRIYFS